MAKKVYELANEIGVGAIDLVEKLKAMGLNVRNHMATLSDEEVLKQNLLLSLLKNKHQRPKNLL